MHFLKYFLLVLLVVMCANSGKAQTNSTREAVKSNKFTPAYAELLLRKTELESDVESLLTSYTEEFPKIKEARYELNLIQKDLQTILIQTDASRLSLALGKLMTRRAELATTLWSLQKQYGDEHPDVKRARKKVFSFDSAIKEILP